MPGALDFSAIKRGLGCPPELPILEYLEKTLKLQISARNRAFLLENGNPFLAYDILNVLNISTDIIHIF